MKQVLFSLVTVALAAAPAGAQDDAALPIQGALYPSGIAARLNNTSGRVEKPAFVLHSQALLPDSGRIVVVYSERMPSDLPFEKLHSVYAAVVEKRAGELRVLDRRELTKDVALFLDEPGHVLDVRALVTPVSIPDESIAAVELWASLHGTGAYNAESVLFLSVDTAGKLVPVLAVENSFASGKVDRQSVAGETTAILVGTSGPAAGEIVVERRDVTWTFSELSPQGRLECGTPQVTTYRFDGSTFQPTASTRRAAAGNGYFALPRLAFVEKISCN